MESSRSGLLSTVIMTVPLVIVPALAMFRQPTQSASVATSDLSAGSEAEFLSEFDLPESSPRNEVPSDIGLQDKDQKTKQDFSDWFDEETEPDLSAAMSAQPDSGKPKHPPDPFFEEDKGRMGGTTVQSQDKNPTAQNDPSQSSHASAESESVEKLILQKLLSLGSIKTHWFTPGNGSGVGVAVFFRGDSDQVRYRFEAVGSSRPAVLSDVHQQVVHWKTQLKVERLQRTEESR